MKKYRWAWIVIGGSLIVAGGIGAVACSSDTAVGTGNPSNGGSDSGRDGSSSDDDGATSGDDSSSGDDGGPIGDGGGLHDCGFVVNLHPLAEAGVFCSFDDTDFPDTGAPGQGKGNCALGQHCCEYAADAGVPSQCKPFATACDAVIDSGGADFQCGEPSDCREAGTTCCLRGTPQKDNTCIDPEKHEFGSRVKGTYCTNSACAAGEFVVCSVQSDCTAAGGTCTAFSTKRLELGACVQ